VITLSLIIFTAMLSAMQRRQVDRVAGFLFSVSSAVVYIAGPHISGQFYFHICAIIDCILVFIILKFKTKLALILAKALFISMVLNLLGFISWALYLKPDLYVYCFIFYYSCISYLLITRGKIDWSFWQQLLDSSGSSCVHTLGSWR
jgi:hypothetical protein